MSVKAVPTDATTQDWSNSDDDDTVVMSDVPPLDTAFALPSDFLSFEQKLDVFYVPEMQRNVRLRTLNAREVDSYRQSMLVGRGTNIQVNQRGARAKLAVMAIANEDGSRMFTDKDVNGVMNWPSIVLERLSDRIKKKNGITDDDMGDDAKND